ncbi:MAG: radical SAM protein [Myxococcales bacterium]|nr:radical SAM protein [Myxococcales bacterium]
MQVALEIPDTQAEGPGRRYAVWLQGCPLRCRGCCNPGYLPFEGGASVEVEDLLARIVATPHLEGVTLLGGEPFAQAAEAAALLAGVRRHGLGTLVFTGYTLAELTDDDFADPAGAAALLAETDLLVDGRWDETRPDDTRTWIGSTNQAMHFLTDRHRADDPRFVARDTVEIRLGRDGLTVNGKPWGRWAPGSRPGSGRR